jgi:SAM-dependent methyltransferase
MKEQTMSKTANKRPEDADELRELVSEGYTRVLEERSAEGARALAEDVSKKVGYSDEELAAVPEGANLGVGCGNPTAIDRLRPGETVVDLGSGAGMDAFLAARQVGKTGHVIGVDMTDAMLEKARSNAAEVGLEDVVEFRKGQIEALPIEDESVDAIISNCVINLSPEKQRVYDEAYRVLRPGGRLMISDVVLEHELPELVLQSIDAYIGCIGGASLRASYLETIRKAGFVDVRVEKESSFGDAIPFDDPTIVEAMGRLGITREQARAYGDAVTSLHIFARK